MKSQAHLLFLVLAMLAGLYSFDYAYSLGGGSWKAVSGAAIVSGDGEASGGYACVYLEYDFGTGYSHCYDSDISGEDEWSITTCTKCDYGCESGSCNPQPSTTPPAPTTPPPATTPPPSTATPQPPTVTNPPAEESPSIESFTAAPAEIDLGKEATLIWSGIKNADVCRIFADGNEIELVEKGHYITQREMSKGKRIVTPEKTTSYQIKCYKAKGSALKTTGSETSTVSVKETPEEEKGSDSEKKEGEGKSSYDDTYCYYFPKKCGKTTTTEEKKAEEEKPKEKAAETPAKSSKKEDEKSFLDTTYCYFFPKKCKDTGKGSESTKVSDDTKKEEKGEKEKEKDSAVNKCKGLVGVRSGTEYCDKSENIVAQKEAGKSCENSFECSSNVCAAGKCVDELALKKALCSLGVKEMC